MDGHSLTDSLRGFKVRGRARSPPRHPMGERGRYTGRMGVVTHGSQFIGRS